jgi:hypothetical protein
MRRIAFRLLLCVLLVLNGTGYAVAATQMHLVHMAMAAAAHESASTPPCHDAAPPENMAMAKHLHPEAANGEADPGVPSCCQSSLCSCDCLQHATAAMPAIVIPPGAPPGADIAQAGVAPRVSPTLPNLLRPPIA